MKFIQVGVGGFGEKWIGVLKTDDRAEVVALVDVDEEALAGARRRAGVSGKACYTDLRVALADVDADAVVNVTPPALHHEVALAAFERGLHVLTEKPLADNMDHAEQMVEAADKAGRTLMVSQNYRFNPWAKTCRRLLDPGQFGPPDSIYLRFAKAPQFKGFRTTMEHPLVIDMSIHHFDLMRAITGLEPVLVYATTWNPPWSWFQNDACCMAVFQFEQDVKVCYDATWVARSRQTTWDGYWNISCEKGAVELIQDKVYLFEAEYPDQEVEIEMHRMPCTGQAYALHEFQNALEQGREPESSGRENLRSLAMVFATVESATTGKTVEIAP